MYRLGPYKYGVLSVWFKRNQVSTGCVLNFMKLFISTVHSVADLIFSYDTLCIIWRLPRYGYSN